MKYNYTPRGIEEILARLRGVRASKTGWIACCPAHDDRNPSLTVGQGNGGRILLHCHKGCSAEDVCSALGLQVADLFPDAQPDWNGNGKHKANGKLASGGRTFATAEAAVAALERRFGRKPDHTWEYHDASGELVGLTCRWNLANGKKEIRPISRHADGWRIGAMAEPRPLYNLGEVSQADISTPILITEGEKAADVARSIGFVATTSSGGAGAAEKTDWRPLAGKEVWILPDNDTPGRKYANDVASILTRLSPAPTVRVVELPGLPDGGDIVEWIEAHGDAAEPDTLRAEIEALAQAVEPWRLAAEAEPWRPFPAEALPEPIRGFVEAGARAIGCDVSYLALPLLTAIGAVIGNMRRLELKRGWCVPPILWAAIIGESGTAKSPAFRTALRPVYERQRRALERHAEAMKKYRAELACWDKDFAAWKRKGTGLPPIEPEPPTAERLVASDVTIEALAPILLDNPRGLLLARDELNAWFGSFDRYTGKGKVSSDSANWLSMYNGEPILVDRKTSGPRTIYVPSACVSICGGIQPAILRRTLTVEHRESGLAARLLLAYPPRKAKRWTEADIDPGMEAELVRLFDRLYELQPSTNDDGEPRPVLVRLSDEAKEAWIAYFNAHAVEQTDLTGDMSAAWSKLEEAPARLALVVHFARWAAGDVADESRLDLASMNSGIALAKWFKHEARRVYAMLDESDAERDQRRLIEWVDCRGGTVTAREVQMGCRWLREPGAAEMALDGLVKAGRGSWTTEPPPATGGHSRRVFNLSTPSTSTLAKNPREIRPSVDVDTVDEPETAPPDGRPTCRSPRGGGN